MLNAYLLESEVASYPRIIIGSELLTKQNVFLKPWVDVDNDGHTFLDLFKFEAFAGNADELVADGYDPRFVYFDEIGRFLKKSIEDIKDAKQLGKYRWLANRFNQAVREFNKTISYEQIKLLKF